MNVNLLIDSIVHQTTILIAQLATTAGARATLAHVANQVFVDLVRELKHQGVGAKVVADMFGVALRTYQTRMQRLSESATFRGQSLWEAVLDYVREKGTLVQSDVLLRFPRDDEAILRGILTDLVDSGLVYRTGRGSGTTYRVADPAQHPGGLEAANIDARANVVRIALHRAGTASVHEVAATVHLDADLTAEALEKLVEDGRATRLESAGQVRYRADECIIPVGVPNGWEAAVFDHFHAVVTAICTKLRLGPSSDASDRVGGSTFGFSVWEGHPQTQEILGQLARIRRELSDLRQRNGAYNSEHESPDGQITGVITYVGQMVTTTAPEDGERA
jgi:hypothetical protein